MSIDGWLSLLFCPHPRPALFEEVSDSDSERKSSSSIRRTSIEASQSPYVLTQRDGVKDQLFSQFVSLAAGLNLEEPQEASITRLLDRLRHKDLGVLNKHQGILGYGSFFSVTRNVNEHEEFTPDINALVFKRTIPTSKKQTQYEIQKRLRSLMLELRALVHAPIRRHRNIVDILGVAWEADPFDLTQKWPVIIAERASHGTLSEFLDSAGPVLPFTQKVSLALDLTFGLEVLHVCGILHGDMKADNVLIFGDSDAEYPDPNALTAKLADFSGALFDIQGLSRLPSGTRPWNAPEWQDRLPLTSLMKTDIYSLGLLIYRIAADGKHPFRDPKFADDLEWNEVEMLKKDRDKMLDYMLSLSGYQDDVDIAVLHTVFRNTIRCNPLDRDLDRVEATLQRVSPPRKESSATLDLTSRQLQLRDQPIPFSFTGHEELDPAVAAHVAAVLAANAGPFSTLPSASEAKYALAVLTINGLVRPSDQRDRIQSGLEWLEAAALAGCDRAQAVYARACAAFETRVSDSCIELVEPWLQETASRGFFLAMDDLAQRSLQKSLEQATETLRVQYGGTGERRFPESKFKLDDISIDDVRDFDQRLARDVQNVRKVHGSAPWSRAGDTVLHFAAACGLDRTLEKLLENLDLPDINVTNVRNETPLLLACRSGHYKAAMMLHEAGADASISNIYGDTPLHWLLSFPDKYVPEVAKKFLDSGAAIDAIAQSFSYIYCGENTFVEGTPLMRAVTRNRLVVVDTLLNHHANPNLTHKDASAIKYAAFLHYPEMLKALFARTSDRPKAVESASGMSLVVTAVTGGGLESHGTLFSRVRRHGRGWRANACNTLQLILDNGAAEHLHEVPGYPEYTAVYVAARHAEADILSYLLEHGGAGLVNVPCPVVDEPDFPELRRTPLSAAIDARNLESLELLLRHGAEARAQEQIPSINEPVTLLYKCAWTAIDDPAFARALIDYGVGVDDGPKDYETPFACAVRNRCFKLAAFLYQKGADVNAEFREGLFFSQRRKWSVLGHLVSECAVGTLAPLSFLFNLVRTADAASLSRRENPDFVVAQEEGTTVLHVVANIPFARQDSLAQNMILERVLAHFQPTANMLAMRFTEMEYTALHIAIVRGNARVVRSLLDAGVDPDLTDARGYTALALANHWWRCYPDETPGEDEEHFALSERSRRRLRSNREQITKSIERHLKSLAEAVET